MTLEERFRKAREKFAGNPEVSAAIARRRQDALTIKDRLEAVLGIALEELLRRHAGSLGQTVTNRLRRIYLVRYGAVVPPVAANTI